MEPWDRVGTQSMPEKQFSADDFDRLHVLLVEDNEHMRQLVVRILRTLSISEIKSVTSAAQALDLLSKGYQADLIIADYDMQPMDGVERSDAHTSELPSLMRISYAVFGS